MKAYKGFNKDMTCRGFQFEEGKTYEEPTADLCKSGFHACGAPLDIFRYYFPASSAYHKIELDGVSDQRESDDSIVFGKVIKIGAATAGDSGAATSRGSSSVGENGAALARGNNVKVRGGMGAILVAVEENDNNYDIKSWCAGVVDGETLKPDIWYRCVNGKFVEAE